MANIARDWNFEGEEFEQLLREVERYLISGTKDGPPDLLGLRDWGAARLGETSGCGNLNRNRRFGSDERGRAYRWVEAFLGAA